MRHDMTPSDEHDDLVEIIEDDAFMQAEAQAVWRVLIVDDEPDVHETTILAMAHLLVQGRPLQFLHAHSARQALEVLRTEPDIALVLLDVVMESEHSGLDLVRKIREDLQLDALRIILRTGQPGYAPEIDTIRQFDINDYKTKSELSRVRLYTCITLAIRSYQQIQMLRQSRQGLRLIVTGSTELSKLKGLQTFAQGVVTQLSALLGVAPEGLVCAQVASTTGEDARIVAAAGRFSGLINCSLSDVQAAAVRDALRQCLALRKSIWQPECCLYFSTSSGRAIAAYVASPEAISAVNQELLEVFCASISAGLENVLLYSQLLNTAYQDALLQLPNRVRFVELIDDALLHQSPKTVALVDIDDFSGLNNSLGHQYGDGVLRAVAAKLKEVVGASTMLARVSADRFGLLGPEDCVNPQRLGQAFVEPFVIGGTPVRVSASFGLLRLEGLGEAMGAEVLKDAHIALKQAKRTQHGGAQYFSVAMALQARERLRLLNGLRDAFDERSLFVAYQPQVLLESGRPTGLEALLRWRLHNGQMVPPDQFIPLAEQSGLILQIGEFVLRTALHQLHRLRALGHLDLCMSVNVSQIQLRTQGFLDSLKTALDDAQVPADRVELEVTESTAMHNVETMMGILAQVRETGVRVAIDDFGTGYSSLAVLRQLGAHRLKIDKSFVNQIESSSDNEAIAQMVIDLARRLKMDVIAEGVETVQQQMHLIAMGCSQAQGYLFARPMPAEQLEAWLQA
jgi:diguanylate cyclase (GGDEF)-like protein